MKRRLHGFAMALGVALLASVAVPATALADSVMYRLYNPYTGEHLYTASTEEAASLPDVGWIAEGTGWVAPDSGDPVYRLYNPWVSGGDHHYTMDAGERDALVVAGWTDEGTCWYSAPPTSTYPLHRLYNPYASTGTHHYTLDSSERDSLVNAGWRYEGIAWYGSGSGGDVVTGVDAEDSIRKALTQDLDGLKYPSNETIEAYAEDLSDLEELGVDTRAFVRAIFAGFDYSIDSITFPSDEDAEARVTVTCKSVGRIDAEMTAALEQLVAEPGFDSLTYEQKVERFGQVILSVAQNSSTGTFSFTFEYKLVGNTWHMQNAAEFSELLFA